jgi:hypothetical protein
MDPSVSEYPTPSIYPNFNYSYQSDFSIKTERSVFSASFQTWSTADVSRRVLVVAQLANRSLEISNFRYIHWPVDIRILNACRLHFCFSHTAFDRFNCLP